MSRLLRRATKSVLVCAACAGVGACYFTTDFSGLASSTVVVREGSDGAIEAAVDGETPRDAGDGDGAADGAASCPESAFCDGFERSTVLGLWDLYDPGAGGSAELTTNARSGMRALRSNLTAAVESGAALRKNFASIKTVRYAYSLFVPVAVNRDINAASIRLNFGARNVSFFLRLGDDAKVTFVEQEFNGATQTFFEKSPALTTLTGQWVDVVVQLDVSSTPAVCSVTYAGKQLRAGPVTSRMTPSDGRVGIGTTYSTAGAATNVDFDDVVLSVTAE